jgi:hypothetical protein
MSVKKISISAQEIVLQITFPMQGSMLEVEEEIQRQINEAGLIATQCKLERFDTDGSSILIGNTKYTSKGKFEKVYETLYGPTPVERHVYQTNEGGRTFCPLDDRARIIVQSTPLFAKIVSFKYAVNGADTVQEDLEQGHQRHISNRTVKAIGDVVGDFAASKEEEWEYGIPELEDEVASISVGVDGTCINMHENGWREAMCGSIAFYSAECKRLHTIYVGAMPEYGKEKFHEKMLREINRVKAQYNGTQTIGLSDGAKDNWSFLEPVTDRQVVDFWHVSEYVGKFAHLLFPHKIQKTERENWLRDQLHKLKHNEGGAESLLRILKHEYVTIKRRKGTTQDKLEMARSVITYITNQKSRMGYCYEVENNCPIGSGVTESACKYLIKTRFCRSGSRWKPDGGLAVLSIRSLRITVGRWNNFWSKIDQFGFYPSKS